MTDAQCEQGQRKQRSFRDLTGERFGRWTVVRLHHHDRRLWWTCRCECGTEKVVAGLGLTGGASRSCGCLIRDITSRRSRVHGHACTNKTRTYRAWRGLCGRCQNVSHQDYRHYGARGIQVCERWRLFENFLADMGEAPAGMSIDRIDNDGNYEPGNCRWATPTEQGNNTRRNRRITINEETLTVQQWERRFGIGHATICDRLNRGWSAEDAVTRPTRKCSGRK